MNILVSAYACEPNRGSESEVGWKWVESISKKNMVWVLTRSNNRDKIEKNLPEISSKENIRFIYVDLPDKLKKWKKGKQGVYIYYILWQVKAFLEARKISKVQKFDYIHHITFVSFRFPSFLIFLPGKFIWGPIAAGGRVPKTLLKELPLKLKIKEYLRVIHENLVKYDPIINYMLKKSYKIVAVNQDTVDFIPNKYSKKIIKYPAIGIDIVKDNKVNYNLEINKDKIINVISVGTLTYLKGHQYLIEAMRKIDDDNIILTIIGEGEDRVHLEDLVNKYKLQKKVIFKGGMQREDVLKEIEKTDIFALLSLRDSGGMAILEAMSMAKPIICLDIGGPHEIVEVGCGIKINPKNKEYIIAEIVENLKNIIDNRYLLKEFKINSKTQCKKNFDWNKKSLFINNLYK